MSGPAVVNNDARVRAFLQGLANDPNATQVTPDALRASADGLAGGRVDGTVDAIETEALLTIARDANLPEASLNALRGALRNRTGLDIPRGETPAGPNRFPPYLDTASLHRPDDAGCGCGPSAGVLTDKNGNQMEVLRGERGLEARFARSGQSLEGQPAIALNAAEQAAIAPRLVQTILRDSQQPASTRFEEDWSTVLANHSAPAQAPADERDLTDLRGWRRSKSTSATGERTLGFESPDGSAAWVRYNVREPGQVSVAYTSDTSNDPADSAFRAMSARELATFQASRALAPIAGDFWVRNFTATQGFVSATR